MLIVSGNLAFVNHITLVPLIACFDDRSLACLFSRSSRLRVASNQNASAAIASDQVASASPEQHTSHSGSSGRPSAAPGKGLLSSVWRLARRLLIPRRRTGAEWLRALLELCALAFVAYASAPVVRNLISSEQVMNTSFDRFHLVNTYGYFGRFSALLLFDDFLTNSDNIFHYSIVFFLFILVHVRVVLINCN